MIYKVKADNRNHFANITVSDTDEYMAQTASLSSDDCYNTIIELSKALPPSKIRELIHELQQGGKRMDEQELYQIEIAKRMFAYKMDVATDDVEYRLYGDKIVLKDNETKFVRMNDLEAKYDLNDLVQDINSSTF